MPIDKNIRKVMVLGSGPIVIGQAAEFDYAGTQACRALKEHHLEVVLVNSNPATIMTDREMADKVYIEPLTVPVLKNIIEKEKPDCLLPTLGGQTGLNLAVELAESGFLAEKNVRLLGTSLDAIRKAEDREAFKDTMLKLQQPVVESVIVTETEAAVEFANRVGYPVIVRPAYTLGGTGGGIADDEETLRTICTDGLRESRVHQALIERCISGWKEIEYEVLRDGAGNCITVCNMENIDPVGIHTGDSIVVAPVQTLRDKENQMLRTASLKIIGELGIQGGCNVQFALNPNSMEYAVIEVNPRVSRSSALASKATGYPIARVAALVAIGLNLDEIVNSVTGQTAACFEPAMDYVVCKFPRWPFDKFVQANRHLGTKMKATGEVMSLAPCFEAAFLKSLRSLELGFYRPLYAPYAQKSKDELVELLHVQNDLRIFCVFECLRKGVSVEQIHEITKIDLWFLRKFRDIVKKEEELKADGESILQNGEALRQWKVLGFSDRAIGELTNTTEQEVRRIRKQAGILPVYNMVDTCAGEFQAKSDYYYSSYGISDEATCGQRKTVVVLGSGPIRIGQGVEFDYCSVHCVWALKKLGYDTVIINNNPETVSTDFDTADRLYFEPLTEEEVLNVLEKERPYGVFVQFGGQTAVKLAKTVSENGFRILGTTAEDIDRAEDREEFDALLTELEISRPQGYTVFTAKEALQAAAELTYPVLVRPSYVLGGQGMEICYNDEDIEKYMEIINRNRQEHPILVDKYIMGEELEVDAVCDGKEILIPGFMRHIERTGIHSGDSISVYPASLPAETEQRLTEITRKLALGTKTIGLINVQFIVQEDRIYIIEVNPRSSRTVPYISKVTEIPMVEMAVKCALGISLKEMGVTQELAPKKPFYAVKVPVFSNEKIPDLEISLSPEMKSTGEVLGIGRDFGEAICKGLVAGGIRMNWEHPGILFSISNRYKQEVIPIAKGFAALGFDLYATSGTAHVLNTNFVPTNVVRRLGEGEPNLESLIKSGKIHLILNTPTHGRDSSRDGFRIRRFATERGIPCLTAPDTAQALLTALKSKRSEAELTPISLQDLKEWKK